MLRKLESAGKTVDEAIQLGLAKMRLTLDSVSIEIIDEGTKGFLGIFGGKLARVMLTELEESDIGEPDSQNEAYVFAEKSNALYTSDKPNAPGTSGKPGTSGASDTLVSKFEKFEDQERRHDYSDVPAEEGESAANAAIQFLTETARLMGVEATVTAKLTDEYLAVNISGENMGILIGHRGDTLDALQYLTSLYINRQRSLYIRVFLDIEQYRERREESIIRLAEKMAVRAIKSGRRVAMEPMNAYERRIFHSALQNNPDVTTHSEGEDPNRRIIILPKRAAAPRSTVSRPSAPRTGGYSPGPRKRTPKPEQQPE